MTPEDFIGRTYKHRRGSSFLFTVKEWAKTPAGELVLRGVRSTCCTGNEQVITAAVLARDWTEVKR